MFLLDENDVADRLLSLEEMTGGAFRWSETAGLKQLLRDAPLDMDSALEYVARDFSRTTTKKAA